MSQEIAGNEAVRPGQVVAETIPQKIERDAPKEEVALALYRAIEFKPDHLTIEYLAVVLALVENRGMQLGIDGVRRVLLPKEAAAS